MEPESPRSPVPDFEDLDSRQHLGFRVEGLEFQGPLGVPTLDFSMLGSALGPRIDETLINVRSSY